MIIAEQNKRLENFPKEIFPLFKDINKSFSFSNKFINIPKNNILVEPEQNKGYKFITKKRGRINKVIGSKNLININNRKVHNKFRDDNIKRRLKGLYNGYIIHFLNKLLKKRFKRYKIKFSKMNIRYTKDIGIEFNNNLLETRIKDIIIDVSEKFSDKENNKNCIKFIQTQNDIEEIMQILNMTYKDFFINYYLKSNEQDDSYEAHKEKILEIYGKEYLEKFIKNAETFVEFFKSTKKRKSRKQKEKKINNIHLENENIETTSTNNDSNSYDNVENYFKNKNMTCSYTQTDISDINVKLLAF